MFCRPSLTEVYSLNMKCKIILFNKILNQGVRTCGSVQRTNLKVTLRENFVMIET